VVWSPQCRWRSRTPPGRRTSPRRVARGQREATLLSEAVTAAEQLFSVGVPDREGGHALEEVDHRRSVLRVEVDENLRVTAGGEAVPMAAERLSQLRVVVDLAVQRGAHRPVLMGHRLTPAAHIDDAQAPGAQPHAREVVR
jgi:hypothetical protein